MKYKNVNDYETIYLIHEGDDDSIATIFEKYKPIIYSIAKKYYSRMNCRCGDLDDFVQEGYIGLEHAIRSFREDGNALFYTFSMVCIERQIQGFCKKAMTLKNENMNQAFSIDSEIEENITLMDIYQDPYQLNNPDDFLEQTQLYDKLIKFKNNLSITQSLVFELRYNGFKYREIATLLGVSLSTVDSSIHVCKKKLTMQFENL